ncbi:MAG: hypothetical protein PVI90_00010 [Desulfobacteraceae bacterium]|jgi:hypothetical protein
MKVTTYCPFCIDVIHLRGLNGFVQKDRVNPCTVSAVREREYGNEIAFSISKSDRDGEGWVLYRYDDHPRIDFNFLHVNWGHKLRFIHVNGFIAKTNIEVNLETAIKMMEQAIDPLDG